LKKLNGKKGEVGIPYSKQVIFTYWFLAFNCEYTCIKIHSRTQNIEEINNRKEDVEYLLGHF